jgi:hypothetical protein
MFWNCDAFLYSQIQTSMKNINYKSLSSSDSLLLKCLALNRKTQIEYKIPDEFSTEKCGFSVVSKIKKNWEKFSQDQKQTLKNILYRPEKQRSILSKGKNFRIHFDTLGFFAVNMEDNDHNGIPDYVDSVAFYFEYSLDKETKDLSFEGLLSDNGAGGGNEYDIYIEELSNNTYGSTFPDEVINTSYANETYTSYITIDNNFEGYFSPGISGLKVTAAHELFHAIQLCRYGVWWDDQYFYEICSTCMEQIIFPEIKDYLQYLYKYYSRTNIPFYSQEDGYSLVTWGLFLKSKYNPDILREILNYTRQVKPLIAMDKALQDKKSSFINDYFEFSLWNYFTSWRTVQGKYFPDAKKYPLVSSSSVAYYPYVSSLLEISSNLQSLSTKYIFIPYKQDTITIIIANTNFDDAAQNLRQYYNYKFEVTNYKFGENSIKLSNGINIKFSADEPHYWKSIILLNNESVTESEKILVYPNPFYSSGNQLTFLLPKTNQTKVDLNIFSSNNVVFKSQCELKNILGQNGITWDGKDNNGYTVSSGIYFYYILLENKEFSGKIAIIRK